MVAETYVLNCTAGNTLGCQMSNMGGTVMSFLNVFGDPASTIIFFILIAAFIGILFLSVRRVIAI